MYSKKYVSERICELSDDHVMYRGDVVKFSVLVKIKEEQNLNLKASLENSILCNEPVEIKFLKNISDFGSHYGVKCVVDGENYTFLYTGDVVQRSFRGFDYYLPEVKGKGKKIKGKTFFCNLEMIKDVLGKDKIAIKEILFK